MTDDLIILVVMLQALSMIFMLLATCYRYATAALSQCEARLKEVEAERDRLWGAAILDEGPEAIQRITSRISELQANNDAESGRSKGF